MRNGSFRENKSLLVFLSLALLQLQWFSTWSCNRSESTARRIETTENVASVSLRTNRPVSVLGIGSEESCSGCNKTHPSILSTAAPFPNRMMNSSARHSLVTQNSGIAVPLVVEPKESSPRLHQSSAFRGTARVAPIAALLGRTPKVIAYNGNGAMKNFIQHYGRKSVYCDRIESERSKSPHLPLTMQISFGCDDLYRKSEYGTGNFLSWYYGLRLATTVYTHVGLNFTCHDAPATRQSLVFPWLTGWVPPRTVDSPNPFPKVTLHEACSAKISHFYKEIQFDFRRMAIGLVGLPDDNPYHPSFKFAGEHLSNRATSNPLDPVHQLTINPTKPVFPKGSVQLDDAAIHFRCGDLMDSDHTSFAFLKFDSYIRDISPDARSIGIITQPFPHSGNDAVGQNRHVDDRVGKTVLDRCRTVVLALVDYIQERHPKSRVTVHNGPSETIALAYARLVMANQTIVGISTFGVFPALATFGTGYLHQPQGPFVNSWMFRPRVDKLASNFNIFRDPVKMMVVDMKRLWETQGADGVVAWFRNDRPNALNTTVA